MLAALLLSKLVTTQALAMISPQSAQEVVHVVRKLLQVVLLLSELLPELQQLLLLALLDRVVLVGALALLEGVAVVSRKTSALRNSHEGA
jgi:cell division ATPase FtsA